MSSSSLLDVVSIIDYKRPFNVDLGSITEYFSSVLASDGNLDRGALKNGNLLFKDHFIQNINVARQYVKRTILAKCRAQMKKATTYEVQLIMNTNRPSEILEGTYQCVAGDGHRAAFKHLAALCFALLDHDHNKLYEACTQRLQQWHHPTKKSSNPVNLLDINFYSLQHNKAIDSKPKYLQFLQTDVHVPEVTTTLQQLLVKYNQQSTAAAAALLPQPASIPFIPLPIRVISEAAPPLHHSTRSSAFKYYMDHIYLSATQISALEENTRGQSSSVDWHEARRYRITSTTVHSISTHQRDFNKLAKTILQHRGSDLTSNLAVRHGILNEELCRRRYVNEQAKNGVCSTTYPCGLVVDPTTPYICCSPDAVIMEKANNIISYGILECKCVFSEPGAIWDDLIHGREHFCLERYSGRLRLRPGHPYYYQLIALMGILDLPGVDICIMKNEEIYIERLINDENVWFTVKEKLSNFFFKFFLPEIIKSD
ncbi:unnamed protein product [Rotaria magnacalcarata]|uniref:YqaJ viral recombinase domain-containing protein n=1 Tax=Rotaria magnacalcarata TaxID=392030 RepID=A0A815N5E4_9BILA|nr:unnamed protein product [Rotaria magnacalcarata]CAF2161076.1 unnamed protein product [Rotaria magnacalcarata]CAF4342605.1 unnamed protein product [Rotaria magnacalcarata]